MSSMRSYSYPEYPDIEHIEKGWQTTCKDVSCRCVSRHDNRALLFLTAYNKTKAILFFSQTSSQILANLPEHVDNFIALSMRDIL